MKKITIGIIVLMMIVTGLLSGCSNSPPSKRHEGLSITNHTDSEITIVYSVKSNNWSVQGQFVVNKSQTIWHDYGSNPPVSVGYFDFVVTASYTSSGISDTRTDNYGCTGSLGYTIYGVRYTTTPTISIAPPGS